MAASLSNNYMLRWHTSQIRCELDSVLIAPVWPASFSGSFVGKHPACCLNLPMSQKSYTGHVSDYRESPFQLIFAILTWPAGRRNYTADSTLLTDFEELVNQIGLNKTSIINPPYDGNTRAFTSSSSLLFMIICKSVAMSTPYNLISFLCVYI